MTVAGEAARAGRWRRPVARLLTIVGVVLVLVSVAANYVERQALDTDDFETMAQQLIDDPAIQAQIAQSLTDQLFSSVDVQDQLEQVLPPDQQGLAGPLTGALRPVAERLAARILDRPRFQKIWVAALTGTQRQIVRILDDETRFMQTENGAVVINLRQLLIELANELPISPGLAEKIPPDKGVIHLFDAQQVDTAQTVTRVLRAVADWIWVLALAAWIGAVIIARDRRKELRAIAIGFVAVGFLLLLVRRVAGGYLVDKLGEAASTSEDAVQDSWQIITRLLADAAWAAIAVGVIALLGIWVAGPSQRATQVRGWLAPHLRRWEIAYGSAAFLFLLLLLWGPISYIRKPSTVIVFAVLAALGVEALRRQVARESTTT